MPLVIERQLLHAIVERFEVDFFEALGDRLLQLQRPSIGSCSVGWSVEGLCLRSGRDASTKLVPRILEV